MSEVRRINPAEALLLLRKKWDTHHASWLAASPEQPAASLSFTLASITDQDVNTDREGTLGWVSAWRDVTRHWSSDSHRVEWVTRRWPSGEQSIPHRLVVPSAAAAAELLGIHAQWERLLARYALWRADFPELSAQSVVLRICDEVLGGYSDADFMRLMRLLSWLRANPCSGMYLRQLPVEDIDTKWIEARRGVVADLARLLLQRQDAAHLHEACGLTLEPPRLRMRILDTQMRQKVGGLGDIQAPRAEIACLPLQPRHVLIVENLNTGIAMPDLPGTIIFLGLGIAVNLLDGVNCISQADRILYWGDIDTHGFIALARARKRLPKLQSILMDESTLRVHQALWVTESKPSRVEHPEWLTEEELAVYEGLRTNRWGDRVRLEQERIGWPMALAAVKAALGLPADGAAHTLDRT
jgi:hypothetical protein